MAYRKLSMTRGDTQIYSIKFQTAAGVAYCLKNWTVFFTVKSNPILDDSQALIHKIVTSFADSTAGTSGLAQISLAPADTVNIDPGEYDFDIAVCTSANENYTVMKGKFELEYDVTRSIGTAGTAV